MKRKSGEPHKGWKASAKKYKVSGVWRTGIPQRMRRKELAPIQKELSEENETTNEYVSDNGQFGVGA